MTTTLRKIKDYNPCEEGWKKLLKSLNKTEADDEPLTFSHILESNGLGDTVWAMRSAPEYYKEWRLFAVFCARQVQHLLTDERSIKAIDVAEKYANGLATDEELTAAWYASAAAWDAARDAASAAARDAAWAAWAAARAAAWAAARAAARDAARDAQKEYLTKLFMT